MLIWQHQFGIEREGYEQKQESGFIKTAQT